jgi:di/tricarboxylate transporter
MTTEILIVLAILILAVVLFVSEKVRPDLVALMVMAALALTGLVTPSQALLGFSSSAVVTVWAVLILSAALSRSGVANIIGNRLLGIAGNGLTRLTSIIMLTVGVLSSLMNNIGATSLMLPVVVVVARRTKTAPSKLLMPLAFGGLLGGMTTLIGTPPNILVSDSLTRAGLPPLRMFDFAPTGVIVTLVGVGFMALLGRRLLPSRDIAKEVTGGADDNLGEVYALKERLFVIRLPRQTPLDGMTLMETRLGPALGVNVLAIRREGEDHVAPGPAAILKGGDRLVVLGREAHLKEVVGRHQLELSTYGLTVETLLNPDVGTAHVVLDSDSGLVGTTLRESDFRRTFGLNVLGIWRDGMPHRTQLGDVELQPGDTLLVQGPAGRIEQASSQPGLTVSAADETEISSIGERLFAVNVPVGSGLAGKSLAQSHLADVLGLSVLGIMREGQTHLMPDPDQILQAGDTLLVEGRQDNLRGIQAQEDIEIEDSAQVDLASLQRGDVGLSEVVLAPRTHLVGKTLKEIRFRDKYKMNAVAIMRSGRAMRSNIGEQRLQFGDALLLFGHRRNLSVLATDPDFLVLEEESQEPPRYEKAPLAALIMAGALVPVMFGWLPIAISLIVGVILMILSGCLTMDEAYRAIEWKAIFLIAGMLPLGTALENTGTASFLATTVVELVGGLGPIALMAALFILTALASQAMPNAAVAVLLAPIAIDAAADIGVSPYPLIMSVAISASAAFLSPVGHPANLLVMGPGGYTFRDFTRVGAPLMLVILAVVLLTVPLIWPFEVIP